MIRKIIEINEELCNGCGICANACHENAIKIINNKAKLIRDDYCDGLGACLPKCPVNAISFIEKDTLAFNEEEVKKNILTIEKDINIDAISALKTWPVQIKLAPLTSPIYNDADLLIAADCTAYAYGDFHNSFIKGRTVLVGCTKLDNTNYAIKLSEIIRLNSIKSITVVKMSVPCCKGIEIAARSALESSFKNIPLKVITIKTDGSILN